MALLNILEFPDPRLKKVARRVTQFDVYIDEKVRFGALLITPRVCYNRPPTEEPRTDAYIEIDEQGALRFAARLTLWPHGESWLLGTGSDHGTPFRWS